MVTISLLVVRYYCSILSLIYQHMLFLDANTCTSVEAMNCVFCFQSHKESTASLALECLANCSSDLSQTLTALRCLIRLKLSQVDQDKSLRYQGGKILLKPQYPTHHSLLILLIFLIEHTVSLRHHLLSSIFFVSSHLITLHES